MSKALELEVKKLEDSKMKLDQKLDLPLKNDGSNYKIEDLKGDQVKIMTYIFSQFSEWQRTDSPRKINIQCFTEKQRQKHEYEDHKLTRMTISGAGGTAKSVLIKTLITTARRMFKRNDVAFVRAPTGSAGHNAGGETNHKLFGINSCTGEVSSKKKEILLKRLMQALFIVIDKRSMCNCLQLGTIENNCRN